MVADIALYKQFGVAAEGQHTAHMSTEHMDESRTLLLFA
jgi:hypothetical protein